jgi:6-hydroxymethylpterin diphosphokinase MptE-like
MDTILTTTAADPAFMKVIDGIALDGTMNVPDEIVLAHMAHNIRLGHPQLWKQPVNGETVALVGSGPSLNDTVDTLRELVWSGAKLVTVNGSYRWCLEHNLKPSAQIILDARATNARFLDPEVPNCGYYLASQCHPDVFAAVAGRPRVAIWHSVDPDGKRAAALDAYYLKQWHGISGGTTVITRAIGLLRTLGYLKFHLFGVDSCWRGTEHHAFDQVENQRDRRLKFTVAPTDAPEKARDFYCAPWHVKQAEDFLLFIRCAGQHFRLHVHGDGLIAYMLHSSAESMTTSVIEVPADPEDACA